MNRNELEKKFGEAASALLQSKGYISYADLFMAMGRLTAKDHEDWRHGRIPYLEKVVGFNLAQIGFVMKTVRRNSLNGKLRPSWTAYMSWGKGPKRPLRFSRSGARPIEELWATHFVRPKPHSPEACAAPNRGPIGAPHGSSGALA